MISQHDVVTHIREICPKYFNHNEKQNKDVYMVALRDDTGELIGYYEKHEYRNREMMERYDYGDKC